MLGPRNEIFCDLCNKGRIEGVLQPLWIRKLSTEFAFVAKMMTNYHYKLAKDIFHEDT